MHPTKLLIVNKSSRCLHLGINISKFPKIQDKKNNEEVQTDRTAINMDLEIRLFLGLTEFASLMQCQATGASIFRLESGAEFLSYRRKK